MQAAEGCIKQVKLGSFRKMIKTGTPKPLWEYCLELEGGIRSLTALDIYGLQGQVPQTNMSGETADISPYCEFGWFQWVMYYEPNATYPDDKCYMGRWLVPAVDVGPAMTHKVQSPMATLFAGVQYGLGRPRKKLLLISLGRGKSLWPD